MSENVANPNGQSMLSDEELAAVSGGHAYWSPGYEKHYTNIYNLNRDNGWIPETMTFDEFLNANCPNDLPARELWLKDPKHSYSINDDGTVNVLSGVTIG